MAVGDAHVFPGLLTPVLTQLFFPEPPTTFLTCFCSGERRKYTRKFASTGDQTHNHQVMSPTCSPLSHPGGAINLRKVHSNFLTQTVQTLYCYQFVTATAFLQVLGCLYQNFSHTSSECTFNRKYILCSSLHLHCLTQQVFLFASK